MLRPSPVLSLAFCTLHVRTSLCHHLGQSVETPLALKLTVYGDGVTILFQERSANDWLTSEAISLFNLAPPFVVSVQADAQ